MWLPHLDDFLGMLLYGKKNLGYRDFLATKQIEEQIEEVVEEAVDDLTGADEKQPGPGATSSDA